MQNQQPDINTLQEAIKEQTLLWHKRNATLSLNQRLNIIKTISNNQQLTITKYPYRTKNYINTGINTINITNHKELPWLIIYLPIIMQINKISYKDIIKLIKLIKQKTPIPKNWAVTLIYKTKNIPFEPERSIKWRKDTKPLTNKTWAYLRNLKNKGYDHKLSHPAYAIDELKTRKNGIKLLNYITNHTTDISSDTTQGIDEYGNPYETTITPNKTKKYNPQNNLMDGTNNPTWDNQKNLIKNLKNKQNKLTSINETFNSEH